MSTFLVTVQIVCYTVGIVSASLNIASLLRRWHAPDAPYERDEAGHWR